MSFILFDNLLSSLDQTSKLINDKINNLIPEIKGDTITYAMRYSVLSPGKRLRPFLVVNTANIFEVDRDVSLTIGAAIEMIHAYSLIHDDLPALDNDDTRRGQASCHIEFGEANAILAGNALLTLAFEILASELTHCNANIRCKLISSVAKAVGTKGMIGGQALDILYKNKDIDINDLIRMQRMKTGELFAIATEISAIVADAPKKSLIALRGYAHNIGIAFQIMDDIKDNDQNEASFIKIMGLEKSKEQAIMLSDQAIDYLEIFDHKADNLRSLAKFIIEK